MNLISFDFINSKWYKDQDGVEPFTNEEWLKKFFNSWELSQISVPKGESLSLLLQLRNILTDIVEHIQHQGNVSESHVDKLNYFMSLTPVYGNIQSHGEERFINYTASTYDWNWIVNNIVYSFSELICSQGVKNIKICENSQCKFVFYDSSKNHSKRWCCNTCGSLIKVRRFRAKAKDVQTKV